EQVSDHAKEERWRAVMEVQAGITGEQNRARVGSRTRVLVEGWDEERGQWFGHSPAEAPEVDGRVYVKSRVSLTVGQFVPVEITAAAVYDVSAGVIDA
ncbi:MAG: 30S ribosomal protein S12 methylthiotransferase RimO, partial [Candidatus Hydrogenedentes bacterium]|nr:30S ribosomal protein S12 methylthiotransferase RimO [Candidatus Hydrogenedentota bacterium]